ncbi:type IV toxin-antitoxin system AbiEi family antitoxin domain-containing protein [Microbacterium bovistercoris]|uniref:type IV toxin-antitoxin system AbiEi family antitoxin domain-containing protein n=1 Tax=Microbacterium bovistercoris TaxID=2293570 RepID=UPI001FE4B300|nr:type IV toxin-antitoxin system AbiEi family antitoxin domain-containing protein [Microbacterium bovistercoris]
MLGDMLDPQTLITRLGGVAQGTRLQEFGVSRMRLSQAVRQGRIERLRAGVYATATAPRAERDAARHGGR